MERLETGKVGKQLSALIAAGELIEITRYGKPVAILKPYPVQMDVPISVHPSFRPESENPTITSGSVSPTNATNTVSVRYNQAGVDELLRKVRR